MEHVLLGSYVYILNPNCKVPEVSAKLIFSLSIATKPSLMQLAVCFFIKVRSLEVISVTAMTGGWGVRSTSGKGRNYILEKFRGNSAETWLERFDGADSDKVGESGGMIAL